MTGSHLTSNQIDRIPRHDRDPVLSDGVAHPQKVIPVAFGREPLEVRYHRTGWRHLSFEVNEIKRCHTAALILTDGQHVGSLEVNEFRVAPSLTSNEFLEGMDTDSQATYDLADVLCANWYEIGAISDFGDIVELKRAWMSARFSNRGRFAAAANALIGRLFKRRSLLILKAFPLEYEGNVTEGNNDSFILRQRAMKRYYQKIFGVLPFPGTDGENGWMYSVPERLRDIIPSPLGRVQPS